MGPCPILLTPGLSPRRHLCYLFWCLLRVGPGPGVCLGWVGWGGWRSPEAAADMNRSTFTEKGDHHESQTKLKSGQETSRGVFWKQIEKRENLSLECRFYLEWGLFLLRGTSSAQAAFICASKFLGILYRACTCVDSIYRVETQVSVNRVEMEKN